MRTYLRQPVHIKCRCFHCREVISVILGILLPPSLDTCCLCPRHLVLSAHLIAVVIDERAPLDENPCVAGCPEHCTVRFAVIPLETIHVTEDSDFRVPVAVDDASTFLISPITLECRAAENDCPASFIPCITRRKPDCSGLGMEVGEDGGESGWGATWKEERWLLEEKCHCCCHKVTPTTVKNPKLTGTAECA